VSIPYADEKEKEGERTFTEKAFCGFVFLCCEASSRKRKKGRAWLRATVALCVIGKRGDVRSISSAGRGSVCKKKKKGGVRTRRAD